MIAESVPMSAGPPMVYIHDGAKCTTPAPHMHAQLHAQSHARTIAQAPTYNKASTTTWHSWLTEMRLATGMLTAADLLSP